MVKARIYTVLTAMVTWVMPHPRAQDHKYDCIVSSQNRF